MKTSGIAIVQVEQYQVPGSLESEHRFMHFNTMNCICHTGSYKTQAAGRHNTHVQTGAFQGSCHFILGHYACTGHVLTTDRTVTFFQFFQIATVS